VVGGRKRSRIRCYRLPPTAYHLVADLEL